MIPDINKLLQDYFKKENDILEAAVRKNATPKIKGEITKGKLKWRGIRLIIQSEHYKTKKWVEQRGVIISPVITFEATLK